MRTQKLSLRLASGIVGLMLVAVLTLGQAGFALAHAKLKTATVLPDATLTTAPTSISLTFTEETSPTQTKVQVLDSTGKAVDKGDLKVSEATATLSLNTLTDGKYTVKFRSFSDDDGHTVDGEYTFTVAKAGTAAAGSLNSAKQTEGQAAVAPQAAPNTGVGGTATSEVSLVSPFILVGLALISVGALAGLTYLRRRTV